MNNDSKEANDETKDEVDLDVLRGRLTPNTYYILQNKATSRYLCKKEDSDNLQAVSDNNGDATLFWKLVDVGGGYSALQNKATNNVLDQNDDGVFATNDVLEHPNHQWRIKYQAGGYYALVNRATNFLLDENDDGVTAAAKDETHPNHQWKLMPQNYKLKAKITIDYGDDRKELDDYLKDSHVEFVGKVNVHAYTKGLSISKSFSEEAEDSFTYGFTETIGAGIECEAEAGVIFAKASVTVSASFELSSSQEWSTSTTKTYETSMEFAPEELGAYECGMKVNMVKNQKIPFKAQLVLSGKCTDPERDYSGQQLAAVLIYNGFETTSGFNCKITKINKDTIEAVANGTMTATFAVDTTVYARKMDDAGDETKENGNPVGAIPKPK